jgi:hypothetical protein
MQGLLDDGEDDILRPGNNEKRQKISQMILSRQEVSYVIQSVMKNYAGLQFDKQIQFFNFLVKANWKITDREL